MRSGRVLELGAAAAAFKRVSRASAVELDISAAVSPCESRHAVAAMRHKTHAASDTKRHATFMPDRSAFSRSSRCSPASFATASPISMSACEIGRCRRRESPSASHRG